jgi:predicted ATPase
MFPAAELFLQRARASIPGFCLQDGDGSALAEVCNKLDGIPLAIELAATRVDLFDLRRLAKELDHSLQILTRGRRTAQERHRTLRSTLDWSFRLLTVEEQALFARLGVFRNAFDRDYALAVAIRAGQAVSICFTLAIAGCSIALWNRDFCEVERCLAILREHALRAKSAYWFEYVNVFEIGLLAFQAPHDTKRLLSDARTSKWDYRHWENFSVLGEGFAPPEFLYRARRDAHWWCSPEILRLEAHRICRGSANSNRNEAHELLWQGLRTAQEQKALAWELRLAISILEFAQSSEEKQKARSLLSTTVNDFTEGFSSDIVRQAEQLLEHTSRFV